MGNRLFVQVMTFLIITFSLSAAAEAAADYAKLGFEFPRDRRATVLVGYPDIIMNRQGEDGQEIPSPEWTSLAQRNLQTSLENSGLPAIVDLRFMAADQAAASPLYRELLTAYHRRTGEMIFKVPQGSSDITKAKKCRCTYDFAEIKDRIVAAFGPAEYVLLINQYDTYATTGQILGEIAGAGAVRMVTPQSTASPMRRTRIHAGNAILFDLNTGEVVWMHGDGAFGGDLRKPETATIRVRQVLTGFPSLKN